MKASLVVRAEQRIIPFWYRGSLTVDPLKGNGHQTNLENDIREFEAWQHAEAGQ